jgi:hypothetical protein
MFAAGVTLSVPFSLMSGGEANNVVGT